MVENKKVAAVIPAYNTAKTIQLALDAIPRDVVDDIIVVDDGSKDETAAIARQHTGVVLIQHNPNRGYGAAQKSGYNEALRRGADVVVMVHADFQYDPTLIPQMVEPIAYGRADVTFGSRMANKKGARKGGMPLWRFVANMALTWVEDSVLRLRLTEYHTGYRAYSADVLRRIPFSRNSNNYVFDTEMIAEFRLGNFRVAEIAIPTRYREDSQSPNFVKSVEYGCMTLLTLLRYLLHRSGVKSYPQFQIRSHEKIYE